MKNLYSLTKVNLVLLFLLLGVPLLVRAQERSIQGKVSSQEDGTPLPGVSVLVKGSTSGTITDVNGNYKINVPSGNTTLVFTFVGFTAQEFNVGNQTTLDVRLVPDVKSLSEVVVTGYGSQAKRDITGAVTTVDAKQLLAVPSTNVAQALQGRAAGVTVGNDNSPGGGVMVRIRGFGTINDNSPLYVIDGVPTKGSLNTINQNDIESIQILKDASSASIYGSRAGNGVVIITTKKGKSGKPKLTFNAYYGVQRPGKMLDLLNTNELANLIWESETNAGNLKNVDPNDPNSPRYPSNPQYGIGPTPVIPDYIFPTGAKATLADGTPNPAVNPANYSTNIDDPAFGKTKFLITPANKQGTDWQNAIFNPAPIQNYQLGVSGGNEGATYAASFNYFNQEGILKYTGYKRYTARANTQFNVNKRVRIGENMQVAFANRVGQPNGNNNESNPIMFAIRMQPIIPLYDIAGNFAGTRGGGLGNARNPLALLYRNQENVTQEIRLFGNAFAEVDLLKNLTARTSFGIDYNIYNLRNFNVRDIESSEAAVLNSLANSNSYDRTWTWYNTLTYNTTIADIHRINVIAGTEAIKSYGESFTANRSRFAVDDLNFRYLDGGFPQNATNGSGTVNSIAPYDWALFSYFGKINYSFNDKYLLDLTFRRDASSRFAPTYRSAVFPAVSAGWRISQEGFMKQFSFINDLKLRAGWGQTGNQEIGNYNSYTQFRSSPTESNYDLNGIGTGVVQGFDLSQFSNPNARWEATTATNVGLDFALLGGQLSGSVDWYYRKTTDMLFPVQLQYTQGSASYPFVNIGAMSNKGVDVALNYNGEAAGGKFTYGVSLNFSTYRNQVLKTDGNPNTRYPGFTTRVPSVTATQEGYPISSFYGYYIDGIFQTQDETNAWAKQRNGDANRPGQFKFRDINSDGKIDGADQTFIGNPHPDFTYGLNVTLGYKNFTLTLFGQGVQGNQLYNYLRYWTDFNTFQGNRSKRMYYDSWRPGKTDAKLPQLNSKDSYSGVVPSTYFLEDGSFLRMKNIQLAYDLPKGLLGKLGLSQCQVYVQGQNLLTFTKYTGLDPEINLRNADPTQRDQDKQLGMDEGAYPVAKSILVGLNLGF